MEKIDEIELDAEKKAAYFENRSEEEELEDSRWAVKNGLSFSGPGAIQKAIEAAKKRNAANSRKMATFRIPEGVIAGLKRNAARAGMRYQTYVNTVLAEAAK